MDQSSQLEGIIRIYDPTFESTPSSSSAAPLSTCIQVAVGVAKLLKENDELVERIQRLAVQKEFSNDPTSAMSQTSQVFKQRMTIVQGEMKRLSNSVAESPFALDDKGQPVVASGHGQAHRKLIIQMLQSQSSAQVQTIQVAVKAHGDNVKTRQKRVERYGSDVDVHSMILEASSGPGLAASTVTNSNQNKNGTTGRGPMRGPTRTPVQVQLQNSVSPQSGSTTDSKSKPKAVSSSPVVNRYALFADPSAQLRKRTAASGGYNKTPNAYSGGPQVINHGSIAVGSGVRNPTGLIQEQQGYMPRATQRDRMRTAERVEASIAQMGELFGQMANLVMAQGETISRIEDDVEAGLIDVEAGHSEMNKFLEITKGNRGIILKIFALLIFFIILFMWLT